MEQSEQSVNAKQLNDGLANVLIDTFGTGFLAMALIASLVVDTPFLNWIPVAALLLFFMFLLVKRLVHLTNLYTKLLIEREVAEKLLKALVTRKNDGS